MGKRVLAALLAVAGMMALARPQTAQEATPEPAPAFKAGKFLTSEDYGHIEAALACINLKPSDLNYEKKHRPDDKLRLKVCDAALDDPLGLPRVTEQAADSFGLRGTSTSRSTHAATLLDVGTSRFTIEELSKDPGELVELTKKMDELSLGWKAADKAKRAEIDAAIAKLQGEVADLQSDLLFAGPRTKLMQPDSEALGLKSPDAFPYAADYAVAVNSIKRAGWNLTREECDVLGASLPPFFAEGDIRIPGTKPVEGEPDVFQLGAKTGIDGLLVSACRLSLVLESVAGAWQGTASIPGSKRLGGSPSRVKGVTGGILGAWSGPGGTFVIGGTGPNTYEGDDFIGIIDLGGDDTYKGRVACAIGLEGKAPISFVLDLGGDDRYEGEDFTQGFGFLGVGILHDLGGGDDYYKSRFCAQGCGLCGYGELYDDGGDDLYMADSGAQGAGCFGYGHLIDRAGNDVYRGARFVQAFAQVMGVGVLTDGAGNDLYYAGGKYLHQPLWNDRYQSLSQGFAIGNRNDRGVGTGGGVALLLDEGNGNDVYQCDIYGQGSSYWYSLGMLVDRGGNDTYTLGQYGQGAGIHLSAAILYDESGNDTYSMGVGLGQGAAHDWAVGWQIDRAGNDFYQGNGQGMGLNFSVGILLDCEGDDSHCTNNEGSIGKGSNNDISLLLDLAGTDSYGPKEIKDGQFTRRGDHQLVYDVPTGWFPDIDPSTWPTKQTPAPIRAEVQQILIAWGGTAEAVRTKEESATLRDKVLKLARTRGADWSDLQANYNEHSDKHYTNVVTDSFELEAFKVCALKLGVGQIDWCESEGSFHIIKRTR